MWLRTVSREENVSVSVCDVYSIHGISRTFLVLGVLGCVGAAMSAWYLPCVARIMRRELAKVAVVLGRVVAR